MVVVELISHVLAWAFGSIENLSLALGLAYAAHHARKFGMIAAASMSTVFWVGLLVAAGMAVGVIDVGELAQLLGAGWSIVASLF